MVLDAKKGLYVAFVGRHITRTGSWAARLAKSNAVVRKRGKRVAKVHWNAIEAPDHEGYLGDHGCRMLRWVS